MRDMLEVVNPVGLSLLELNTIYDFFYQGLHPKVRHDFRRLAFISLLYFINHFSILESLEHTTYRKFLHLLMFYMTMPDANDKYHVQYLSKYIEIHHEADWLYIIKEPAPQGQ